MLRPQTVDYYKAPAGKDVDDWNVSQAEWGLGDDLPAACQAARRNQDLGN